MLPQLAGLLLLSQVRQQQANCHIDDFLSSASASASTVGYFHSGNEIAELVRQCSIEFQEYHLLPLVINRP